MLVFSSTLIRGVSYYYYVNIIILDITNILKEAPNEDVLINLFADIYDKWYEIGLSLKVPLNVLDNFKKSNDDDLEKLRKVIFSWKNTQPSPVTWETVITTIKSPVVSNEKMADMIRRFLDEGKSYNSLLIIKVYYVFKILIAA